MGFDELVGKAQETRFDGWDFGVFGDRLSETDPSWSYRDLVVGAAASATRILDMGTGGGEFLASVLPVAARVYATEGYPPNVPLARRRLEPLGVEVSETYTDDNEELPYEDGRFDLVVNRHESFDADELRRVTAPGGRFLTQQVGGSYMADLNDLLGAAQPPYAGWDRDAAVASLEAGGFEIVESGEEFGECVFADIGAVVMYLRLVPWQVEGFSVDVYREALKGLHERMERDDGMTLRNHFFFVNAVRPR